MCGKRDDDLPDAIRYFLNRYRAEVLGEPVAFEEVGRKERYTFVDDVLFDRDERRRERTRRVIEKMVNDQILPELNTPDGVSFRFDRKEPDLFDGDWHEVEVSWFVDEPEFKIDGERVDPAEMYDDATTSVRKVVNEVNRIRERRSFRLLFRDAATTLTVTEPVGVDDFRDLVERLRRDGYGGAPTYDPGDWVDVTYDTSGTVFVCGTDVNESLRDDARYDGTFDGGLSVDGIPVLVSKHAPETKGVIVDTDALVPLEPPFDPPDPKDPRFDVRDPRGIAAINWVKE